MATKSLFLKVHLDIILEERKKLCLRAYQDGRVGSSATAVDALEDDLFHFLGIELCGNERILKFTLASLELLLVLIRLLSDGIIAMISLGLLGGTISGKCCDPLRVSIAR